MKKVIGGIALVVVLAGAIAGVKFGFPWGGGSGDGPGTEPSASEGTPSQAVSASPDEQDQTSEIRIVNHDIFFDGEPCETAESLKQQIIEIGADREYIFIYDEALKSTYDEVNAVLDELKDALGINVSEP